MKLNEQSKPSAFHMFNSFDHDDLIAKHCFFECLKSPDINGIKIW